MGGRGFPPDALAPRSPSGVPVKSRWAITVGTYSSLQEEASSLNDETHQSSSQSGLTCQVSCSWWHIHGERMHMVGVLYEALWEPVFTLSGGDHLNTVLRCWCSLLAWREVVILFLCVPSAFSNIFYSTFNLCTEIK